MAPAAVPAPEVQFAQRLAANEKRIRDRAVKKLRGYISGRTQRPDGTGGEGGKGGARLACFCFFPFYSFLVYIFINLGVCWPTWSPAWLPRPV